MEESSCGVNSYQVVENPREDRSIPASHVAVVELLPCFIRASRCSGMLRGWAQQPSRNLNASSIEDRVAIARHFHA
jgi:hypothetical protein